MYLFLVRPVLSFQVWIKDESCMHVQMGDPLCVPLYVSYKVAGQELPVEQWKQRNGYRCSTMLPLMHCTYCSVFCFTWTQIGLNDIVQ